jgi:hypothetical protein
MFPHFSRAGYTNLLAVSFSMLVVTAASRLRGVSKSSVNGTRKQTKQKIQKKLTLLPFKIIAILHNTLLATFIKLVVTVSKGLDSIVEPLSHVLGLPPRLQNVRLSLCSSGGETERNSPTVLP